MPTKIKIVVKIPLNTTLFTVDHPFEYFWALKTSNIIHFSVSNAFCLCCSTYVESTIMYLFCS